MYYGRGPNKISNPYTMPDFYQDYLTRIDKGTSYEISYTLYKDIVSLYNKRLAKRVLEGTPVLFPYRLGELQVVKKKMYYKTQKNKRLGIDWKNTVKYGKVIHHINEHSDGYKYLFFWNRKHKGVIKNIKSYKLIPTRTLKRELAGKIIKDKKDYFEVN